MAQALLCALPTWHTTKFESLPCAVVIAHGKDPTFAVCLVFVVCFVPWHTAKGDVCRVPDLRRVLILREHGKGHVCRVPIFCRVLVLRAQGKGHVCRVPEIVHTANLRFPVVLAPPTSGFSPWGTHTNEAGDDAKRSELKRSS